MLLKKLTIHNLASISDAEIDFNGEMLGDAPVFLICGETGAGKTTILDAICLALYGNTPRMTSVAKEELELTDAETRNRYYTNDNSQLLRRGTGEGFCSLLFTGNDGKDYEATWEVHRNHDKADKRLQRPRRFLHAADNSFGEHRINEIDEKVAELTGLQYGQFCRTVMLAQGEFTKFLKSRKEDKSEILEKLTGTEIYSRIGIKIAEKYGMIKSRWLDLKREIDGVCLLGDDEVESLKECRIELEKVAVALAKERELIRAKSEWLSAFRMLTDSHERLAKGLNEVRDLVESDDFKSESREIELYDKSEEGRRLLKEISMSKSVIEKKTGLLPDVKKCYDDAVCKERDAQERVRENDEAIAGLQKEFDGYNLDNLSERLKRSLESEKSCSDLLSKMESVNSALEAVAVFRRNLTDAEHEFKVATEGAEGLRKPISEAERQRDIFVKALSNLEISVSDVVRSIREELSVGDTCPVCGSRIETELCEEKFESLLRPLREGKEEVENRLIKLRAEYNSCKAKADGAAKRRESSRRDTESWDIRIDKLTRELDSLKRESGYEDLGDEDLKKECLSRMTELRDEISEIREKQEKGTMVLKNLQGLQKKGKEYGRMLVASKDAVTKALSAYEVLKSDIGSIEKQKEGYEKDLMSFLESTPDFDMESLALFAGLDSAVMVGRREKIERRLTELRDVESKLSAVSEQLKEHEKKRPDIAEGEDVSTLRESLAGIDKDMKASDVELGRVTEMLSSDALKRKELAEKLARLESIREELDSWEGLYNKLGDQKGTKFRAVAQSFILRSLLDNANLYMRNFNERYTLTCNPGTLAILVRDCYKPSGPQPASILSGGESFMASLSLALALSNLQGGGMGADVLFIDEGFGTLSSEYLGNVMDTLEKLHQVGGRKVGLISHVAEMRERIPVHINVVRESPALSRVTVTREY